MEFNQAQYGPYPAVVGGGRVSDENVPITVLVPAHPAFNYPNKIRPEATATRRCAPLESSGGSHFDCPRVLRRLCGRVGYALVTSAPPFTARMASEDL